MGFRVLGPPAGIDSIWGIGFRVYSLDLSFSGSLPSYPYGLDP